VTGSDFFPEPPHPRSGFDYLSLDQLATQGRQFDVVIAMHVLEHGEDSLELLQQIARNVRLGGTLVIEVPNVACMWASVFGRHWDGWYVPFHRHHFSRKSLRHLFGRSGLEIVQEIDARVPTMGRTFRNYARGSGDLAWLLAGIVSHPAQLLGELLTGEPSAVRVILRKPA
jgi:2-polyprenyl-3-methyl-5-hydroxy-6-metoxy-1,4-benzoquinol methylase